MPNSKEELEYLYNEDIERLAEGIREFLQDIPLRDRQKYKALQIVTKNFKDSLT